MENDIFEVTYGKFPNDLEFFVAIAMHGIFYVSESVKKLISKKERPYGITYDYNKKAWLYVGGFDREFVYFDKNGEIEKIKVDKPFHNIHQIDFIEDKLYVSNKRFIKILDTQSGFKIIDEFVLSPKNHSHLNSIFMHNNIIYILDHNKTFYSGIQSQLIGLDRNHKILGIIDNMGHSSHNFYSSGKEDFWCDSYNESLIRNRKVFFRADKQYLTRGLSVSDKYIIVGGSKKGKDSLERLEKSRIYILDRKGTMLCTLKILSKSFILEIRQIHPTCLTITNNNLQNIK